MGKSKQKPVNKDNKRPIEDISDYNPDDHKPEKTGAEIFQEYAENMKTSMEKLALDNQELRRQIGATNQRIATLSATAPEPKAMNPLDIINMITNLMNSPPVKMIIDKIVGGEEAAPLGQNQVPNELADFYMDHFKQTMNLMREQQFEGIRSTKLKNDTLQKEIDSDL